MTVEGRLFYSLVTPRTPTLSSASLRYLTRGRGAGFGHDHADVGAELPDGLGVLERHARDCSRRGCCSSSVRVRPRRCTEKASAANCD